MAANIESLNFEISVNASAAAKEVRSLASAVRSLSRALEGLNPNKTGRAMRSVATTARKAASEVEGLAKAAESMSTTASTSGLKKTTEQLTNAASEAFSVADAMQMVRNAMSSVNNDYTFATNMANSFKSIKMPLKQATDDVSKLAEQAMVASEAMQSIFGGMKNAPASQDWSFWMGKAWGGSNPWESYWVNGEESAQKAGLDAGRAYWESFRISGANMGGQIFSDYSYVTRSQQAFGAISGTFENAIKETQEFTNVQKALGTATKVLSPALNAAGVSAEAFGSAMSAAAAPITVVVIAIEAAVKIAKFLVQQVEEFNAACKKFIDTAKDLNERFNPFVKMKKELASLLALAKRQVLRRAINAVIKAVTEGFRQGVENLAQYDAEFGAIITSMKNALGLFKNSIGVAVAPILSVLIPALNKLLAALTTVMNTIARFTALLTGKQTYTIAAGFEAAEKSAGGANKAAKELQRTILGFDEINKLTKPSDSSGGGGGGSGDDISTYLTESVGDWLYDSWGEALLAFLQWLNQTGVPKIREAFKKIADTVNTVAREVYDALTFPGVQDEVASLGANLGKSLNTFLNKELDWEALGRAIGMGIQTALHFAANFISQINFFELGTNLAKFFNNAIDQINPEDLAEVLFTPIRAAIGLIGGFLMNVDPKLLAEKVSGVINGLIKRLREALKDIDWELIADNIATFLVDTIESINWDDFFEAANSILDGIFLILNKVKDALMNNPQVRSIITQAIEMMMRISGEVLKLKISILFGYLSICREILLKKIASGIKSMFAAIKQAITSLINKIKSALLTALTNQLRRILSVIQNMVNTIANVLDRLGQHDAAEQVREFSDALDSLCDSFNNADEDANEFDKTMGGVSSTTTDVNDKVLAFARSVKSGISDMSNKTEPPITNMRTQFESVSTAAKGMNTEVYNQTIGTNGVTSRLQKMATNSAKPVSDFNTTIGKVSTAAKNVNTEASKQVEALRSTMATKFGQAATNASQNATSIKNSITGSMSNAKNELSKQSFSDVGANIKNGIIGGMGDFYGQLSNWCNQFKNQILKNFKIKSPSRWARDMVGVNIGEGIAIGLDESSSSIERTCAGLKEGIVGEFSGMGILGGVASSAGRARGGIDFASAIGDQLAAAILSAESSDQRPNVTEVYLDTDLIATAVTKGQQKQNRRYTTTD